ncbi:MAG: hypothetical protein H6707_01430 [Deltaproteobacteria bacterium]|nr:hypothetical protein [Deltaproteobacteria bacterium]
MKSKRQQAALTIVAALSLISSSALANNAQQSGQQTGKPQGSFMMPLDFQLDVVENANGKKTSYKAYPELGISAQETQAIAEAAGIDKLGEFDRLFAVYKSIIEGEGKIGFRKKRDYRQTMSILKGLARDTLYSRLETMVQKRGLTLAEVAKKSGIAEATLTQVMQKKARLSTAQQAKLAKLIDPAQAQSIDLTTKQNQRKAIVSAAISLKSKVNSAAIFNVAQNPLTLLTRADRKQISKAFGVGLSTLQTSTEKVMGWGYAIEYSATYNFVDEYKDKVKGKNAYYLARNNAGLRHREVKGSGQPGQYNMKPPGAVQVGVVTYRNEQALTLGPGANIGKLVKIKSMLNPLNWMYKLGLKPEQYSKPAAIVPDKRSRFGISYTNAQGGTTPVADMSLDQVHGFRALKGNSKNGSKGPQATFYGLEIDVAHNAIIDPSKVSGVEVASPRKWTPPHTRDDLASKEFHNDPGVREAYRMIAALYDHIGSQGVSYRPTVPKYTEGLLRLGTVKPQSTSQHQTLSRSNWMGKSRYNVMMQRAQQRWISGRRK